MNTATTITRLPDDEHRERGGASSAKSAKNPHRIDHPATSNHVYEDPAVEFGQAVEAWKLRTGRRYPSWSEALGILKSLGYSRTTASDPNRPAPRTADE